MDLTSFAFPLSISSAVVIGGLLLRHYMGGGWFFGKERIPGKTVIITGANTGIGKETALELARRGGRVILACRDMVKAQSACEEIKRETGSNNVVVKKLDLSSMKSIRAFAEDINTNEQQVNILINNGGIMFCPKMVTEDGFEMQLGVNHLGHFLLTMLLLEKMKASAPSRIVNVSSQTHNVGVMNFDDLNSEKSYSSVQAYAQSKLANVLFTCELAKKLENTGVTVYAVHPGAVDTELLRHVFIYKWQICRILMKPFSWLLFKTPAQGAQTTLYCALASELEGVSGKYYSDCKEKSPSKAAQDDAAAKHLWAVSEKWTQLSHT